MSYVVHDVPLYNDAAYEGTGSAPCPQSCGQVPLLPQLGYERQAYGAAAVQQTGGAALGTLAQIACWL